VVRITKCYQARDKLKSRSRCFVESLKCFVSNDSSLTMALLAY
jgi:hypothetical protein